MSEFRTSYSNPMMAGCGAEETASRICEILNDVRDFLDNPNRNSYRDMDLSTLEWISVVDHGLRLVGLPNDRLAGLETLMNPEKLERLVKSLRNVKHAEKFNV